MAAVLLPEFIPANYVKPYETCILIPKIYQYTHMMISTNVDLLLCIWMTLKFCLCLGDGKKERDEMRIDETFIHSKQIEKESTQAIQRGQQTLQVILNEMSNRMGKESTYML